MERWLVTIVSEKNDRIHEYVSDPQQNLKDCVRLVLTYEKKGYEIFHYTIEKTVGLV